MNNDDLVIKILDIIQLYEPKKSINDLENIPTYHQN